MKQRISIKQYETLSRTALLRWRAYCIEGGFGSVFDEGDFVEIIQPTIGELMEYCRKHLIEYLVTQATPEPIDYLWILVAAHLEKE